MKITKKRIKEILISSGYSATVKNDDCLWVVTIRSNKKVCLFRLPDKLKPFLYSFSVWDSGDILLFLHKEALI